MWVPGTKLDTEADAMESFHDIGDRPPSMIDGTYGLALETESTETALDKKYVSGTAIDETVMITDGKGCNEGGGYDNSITVTTEIKTNLKSRLKTNIKSKPMSTGSTVTRTASTVPNATPRLWKVLILIGA